MKSENLDHFWQSPNVKRLYKCAVIPCIGLGDGLIASVLSHNLAGAGHQVDTYHPLMGHLEAFFPKLSFLPRPKEADFLKSYDHVFFIYEKLPWMQALLDQYPEKTTILNPIATPNRDYLYWEQGRFDGNLPFVDNLVTFCRERLGIENADKDNGIQIPPSVERKKYPQRVVLHPTSSRAGKNWSKDKFIRLAHKLKKSGFEPIFILTDKEKQDWPEIEAPQFENLAEVAKFVAESGWMIGNDSGIGHLASCMGIPTLTICRSSLSANFWRPAWEKGTVVIPPSWIPNLKGMRWRDKKWQHFVPVTSVYRKFSQLCELSVLGN
ncbi:MAG: hypothetical protein K1000chlam2_01042 [Chlamydiae bacterium]|nr:hypothetical protein [Chlamydiota bacterium]